MWKNRITGYEQGHFTRKRINIWHGQTGLNIPSLATLYRLYETGAGYRRSRLAVSMKAKDAEGIRR